jgi:DNA-binding transcriptional regulator YiaG
MHRSTKRTVLQVQFAQLVNSRAADKMYVVSRQSKTPRQAYTKQLAGRIETIRVGMGITPQEMAKRLKLQFQTYRSYEEGRRMMPPYTIAKLARISGHGPWFILTGEPESSAPRGGAETGSYSKLRV